MPVDYEAGLEMSVIAAGVVCSVFALLVIRWGRLSVHHLFAALVTFFVAGLAAFAVCYPILNLLAQPTGFSILESGELQSGVLGLRVSSVLVGAKAGFYLERIVRNVIAYSTVGRVEWQILAQFAIYLPALVQLWFAIVIGQRSVAVFVLNWAFFFIVDDWLILMHYYKSKFSQRSMPWSHTARITAFNLLLLAMLPYIIEEEFGTSAGVATALILSVLLLIRYAPQAFPIHWYGRGWRWPPHISDARERI